MARKIPKWEQAEDYRIGWECYELLTKFRKALEPRLPAGLIEGLKEDLERLGSIGEERKKVSAKIKGFTGSQNDALIASFRWCLAMREALKRGGASESVKKAAGVGGLFPNKRVSVGVSAVNAVIETYEKNPDAFRKCGILPKDIDEGKALLKSLITADEAQEIEKAKKRETTQGRNSLRIRIEDAVDKTVGAAQAEFKFQPETLKLFTALVPGPYKKKGGKKDENEPPQKI